MILALCSVFCYRVQELLRLFEYSVISMKDENK